MLTRIIKFQIFILIIIISQLVLAQSIKYVGKDVIINKTDGTTQSFRINTIDSITFSTIPTSTVTDSEGNVYTTVKIGNQWWMAENLKVTKYRTGESILKVTSNSQWASLDDTETPAYCAYNNNDTYANSYGYLYNWYAAKDSRNIAPEGWRVATNADWEELAQYVATENGYTKTDVNDWNNVGIHLKSTTGWDSNGNGTDDYFFNAIPVADRSRTGSFGGPGIFAFFWSASKPSFFNDQGWRRFLYYNDPHLDRDYWHMEAGYSVRCVKE